ncbi:MAG TPA: TonB family protein [Longimicrobiaceae bacterium]|nr:TonB family protein [Longimicrobiaceae bacterium]
MAEPIRVCSDSHRPSDLTLIPGTELGVGGQAAVYPVPGAEDRVAKVYHRPTGELELKLHLMWANRPAGDSPGAGGAALAWPLDLLRDPAGRLVGVLLPRVDGKLRVFELYNPATRRERSPLFHYALLHRAARNLAAVFHKLHEAGYVVGDVNESNVLVGEDGRVTLIDTDSFQVRDPASPGTVYRCPVGRPEFTPPELRGRSFAEVDRSPEHDRFGLGVLVFQMLMEGTHPFAGRYPGPGEPPPVEERIAAGHFPYARREPVLVRPARTAPPFDVLHPGLRELLLRCFEDGHRDPSARPHAAEWREALAEAEEALVACADNEQHRFGRHLDACPWCERARLLGGRDPFPSRQAAARGVHSGGAGVGDRTADPTPSQPTTTHGNGSLWLALLVAVFWDGSLSGMKGLVLCYLLYRGWHAMGGLAGAGLGEVVLIGLTVLSLLGDPFPDGDRHEDSPDPVEVPAPGPLPGPSQTTPPVPFAYDVRALDRKPELLEPERLAAGVAGLRRVPTGRPDSLPVLVKLSFTVDEAGRIDPSTLSVDSWSGSMDLPQSAKAAILAVRFRPGEFRGTPVRTEVRIPVRWRDGGAEILSDLLPWNPGVDSLPWEMLPDPGDPLLSGDEADAALTEELPVLLNRDEVAAALQELYPPVLRDAGITGEAQVRFVVDAKGSVDPNRVTIVSATHREFAAASAAATARMRFSPARIGGKAVPTQVTLPITWMLER